MGLIDVGANLASESFNQDLDAVLERAWDAGVKQIIVTGSSRESALQAAELARRYPGKLYATAGLHPHHASDWTPELGKLFRELAQQPEVVSLGECGLDYFRDLSPRQDQRHAFIAQLEIAADLKKPLFLHQRDAHEDFLSILREWRPRLSNVVVHCFTDTRAAMNDYLALDCHIGITGWICDERRGAHLIEAVRDIPDDRLLIETDAPYLLPRTAPKQASRRNEPAFLPWVVKALATARDQSENEIARFTSANASRFFGLGH
ncbi:TatD family hydrolase [Stenotrophobium rhamnosiphilum]|uniref:Hydrolase TatD n=1 Tax=Stenotrophobium rhamnosiphilum TaxID=2029166 RepID=A0A2T5MIE1_9GAMM|nr:TatD family hydrolase [Stenotrophobium rhamnosiphilum]PTU32328.1 hydrolase TatD [Stenotrophobium rhamnosiphilum]